MQSFYLNRLSQTVQDLVLEVETTGSVNIEVVPDAELNCNGTTRRSRIEVSIQTHRAQVYAPTDGYFPDGAVLHEVLHIKRFHVERVPMLVAGASRFRHSFAALDNALEHLVIVPEELRLQPERREHWENVIADVLAELPSVPASDRRLAVCLHWTFLTHVLHDSPQIGRAEELVEEYGFIQDAADLADQLVSVISSKEEMLSVLFGRFNELNERQPLLTYLKGFPTERDSAASRE
jgi:hypothetical protein